MLSYGVREKLQHIIRGTVIPAATDHCTVARNFLCASFSTSQTVKRNFESQLVVKKEQEKRLRDYATRNHLWVNDVPEAGRFLAQGGESSVFLDNDNRHVIKINDAGYYATWLEYFNSLVLHSLFFSATAYTFLGFWEEERNLKAIVRQPFIIADNQANLADVREFLSSNGFKNTRRQDYYNKEFGLILEDMHDENVIANSDTLFFIDTVFYTVAPETKD